MLLTTLLVLTSLLPRLEDGVRRIGPDIAQLRAALPGVTAAPAPFPVFQPEARAVSNWRIETGENLRPASLALVARYAQTEPGFVARCVKLNNYWCIKRARWNGELGGDAEGHTGFATAADGADAAAQLLRRYYGALGRRTALAIVRRWAPAECRVGAAPLAVRGPSPKVSADLAPRGIGRTLRARFLARNPRGGVPRAALAALGGPLRVQPWSPLARMGARRPPARVASAAPKPDAASKPAAVPASAPPKGALLVRPSELLVKPSTVIAKPSVLLVDPGAVLGNPAPKPSAARTRQAPSLADRFAAESAALPAIAAGLPGLKLLDLSVPAPLCANDETRIRNYAGRIAGSVGAKMEDDLRLFDPAGRPLANLAPVMRAMSSVELGSLRAAPALVEAAIARLDATTLAAGGAPEPTP
ncbi:hypothetical protein MKK58_07175 [Methylobacterium sp. J-078]|uniref:hypothetical protein n=1 Tax=Methylobacterium sp. J-078 TaxID=2836657 RepID=UPI001FBBB0E5|nr:hypothetical protein [Methylobacterium sp. J-078]MCJ2044315.1 hypothetical protein [Methylobacterium sp. J-078]